jgi:hypothetical protein
MKPNHSQDQKDDTGHETDSSNVVKADAGEKKHSPRRDASDPNHSKSYRRSWRSASPLTKLQLLLTGVIAIATVLYCGFSGWQLYVIHSGGEDTRKLAQAAKEQANTMQAQLKTMQDQANSMRVQTNTLSESLIETRKSVNASEKQADASLSQANTSQASARAAQESARIAQESMVASSRPYVTAVVGEFSVSDPGEVVKVQVKFVNDGNSPAEVTALMQLRLLDFPLSPGHIIRADSNQFSSVMSIQPSTIPPHKEINANVYSNVSLTPSEWEQVKAYKKFLIIYGEGSASGLGGKVPVRFCVGFVYDPNHSSWLNCVR